MLKATQSGAAELHTEAQGESDEMALEQPAVVRKVKQKKGAKMDGAAAEIPVKGNDAIAKGAGRKGKLVSSK